MMKGNCLENSKLAPRLPSLYSVDGLTTFMTDSKLVAIHIKQIKVKVDVSSTSALDGK
jgi:hypothetical protein